MKICQVTKEKLSLTLLVLSWRRGAQIKKNTLEKLWIFIFKFICRLTNSHLYVVLLQYTFVEPFVCVCLTIMLIERTSEIEKIETTKNHHPTPNTQFMCLCVCCWLVDGMSFRNFYGAWKTIWMLILRLYIFLFFRKCSLHSLHFITIPTYGM